jgi:hypothetical protein
VKRGVSPENLELPLGDDTSRELASLKFREDPLRKVLSQATKPQNLVDCTCGRAPTQEVTLVHVSVLCACGRVHRAWRYQHNTLKGAKSYATRIWNERTRGIR